MPTFDTPTPITAALDVPAGRVRVVAAERAGTTVEVLPADATRTRDVQAAERTTVDLHDGVLRVTTAKGDITVTEARSGALALDTQAGDVTVGAAPGVSASLDAGTGYGRIRNALAGTGTAGLEIRATTAYGDITARSL
ncbi:hypothetical protein [Puerhibacterium sp. TATVAM-FAB25]|uniref:hypothetical protein n=1 Tax=Puerhibacterium sp. TATVAM-FAB25 TaxID=3093699 RepID=UPI003978B66C